MKDLDLKKMKDEGKSPNYKSMYSNHEVDLVKEIYNDDIELYKITFCFGIRTQKVINDLYNLIKITRKIWKKIDNLVL